MAYSYLDFAEDILKDAPRPLLPIEIWEIGRNSIHFSKLTIKGKTPQATLAARLYVDVRDNENSRFTKVTSDPARFFLTALMHQLPQNLDYEKELDVYAITKNKKKQSAKFSERELHPLLTYFAFYNDNFNKGRSIYTKTVYHEKSKKTDLNQWVHPDMIGFSTHINYWEKEVTNLNRIIDNDIIKIYSFELKKTVDRSNYRELFFQAVSNSSWAHEGYLVTANLKIDDPELNEELERLTQAFGIGIIYLDIDDINSSRIIFPAKKKELLDWKTINKLSKTNIDFKNFIKDLKNDISNEEIKLYNYDKVIDEIELEIEKFFK